MAPVSKKNLNRKITAQLPRRCPRQVERRIIADYSDFTGSSAFTATGQLATRAALVNANWRGWHLLETDWLDRFKPFIEDGKTIVVSRHKVWGPQTNDLVLQLRKRGIGKVLLGGMLANICVESHLRDLLEQGIEVTVVKDATSGPRHPEWGDGYQAAMINYQFLAHAVLSTDEAVERMRLMVP